MVHLHSAASLAQRRTRAISRGFLKDRTASSCVPYKQASLTLDPWAGRSLPPHSREAGDEVKNAWTNYKRPLPPSVASCETSDQHRIPLSSSEDQPTELDTATLRVSLQNALSLIEAQNSTIMELTARLEYLDAMAVATSPQCGDDTLSHALGRIEKLECGLAKLAGSLGAAIQESVDRRLNSLPPMVSNPSEDDAAHEEMRFYKMLRPHIDDLISPLICSAVSTLSDEFSRFRQEQIPDLFRKYDARVQKQFDAMHLKLKDLQSSDGMYDSRRSPVALRSDGATVGIESTDYTEKIALCGPQSALDPLLITSKLGTTADAKPFVSLAAVSRNHNAIAEWLLDKASFLNLSDPELESDAQSNPDSSQS